MIKVVIDTCVVLDVLQKREPFFHDAVKIFYAAASDQIEGILTAKSITDLFYIHHRFTHDNEATRGILRKLTELFTIADTAASDCHEDYNPTHYFGYGADYGNTIICCRCSYRCRCRYTGRVSAGAVDQGTGQSNHAEECKSGKQQLYQDQSDLE